MKVQRVSQFQLLAFLLVALVLGCVQRDTRRGEQDVLRELAAAHPWLVPQGSDPATHYRPWRRSWCENSNIEMTLFHPPDSIDEGHRVILFKDASNEPVGLVLPSNACTDYWDFEFDHARGPLRATVRFADDLIRVARSLGKADHPREFRAFVFDLFRGSLLLPMTRADQSDLIWRLTSTEGIGTESDSLTRNRYNNIIYALKDSAYTIGVPPVPIAFLDADAQRIFLFEPLDLYGSEPPRGRVHVFRLGQNVIPLEL